MASVALGSVGLVCLVTVSAIAQSGDAGLSFYDLGIQPQVGGPVSFDGQTAHMQASDVNGVGPLAISVISNLQQPTTLAISANSPQNWLQIALSNDSTSCPDITLVRYANSIDL